MNRSIITVVIALSLLTPAPTSPQEEIPIGTELGPEFILHGSFIEEETHPVFRDSLYFMKSLSDGGLTYNRGVTDLRMVFGGDTGLTAYARILDSVSTKLLAYADETGEYNSHWAWKSDRIKKKDPQELTSLDNFRSTPIPPWDNMAAFKHEVGWDSAMGNSMTFRLADQVEEPIPALRHHWRADHNPGGFVIGRLGEESLDLDDNWCYTPDHFMFYTGGRVNDRYRIWLLMKLADDNAEPGDPLLRFYVKSDSASGSEVVLVDSVTVNAGSLSADEWRWVEFHPQIPFNGAFTYFHTRFALRWLGAPNHGMVKFARIAYQSDRNWQLYGGDNDELSDTGMVSMADDFDAQYQAFQEAGARHAFVGWMDHEPWFYGYKTHRDVVEFLHGPYWHCDFTAQYPAYHELDDGFETFIQRTGVGALYVDFFPINCHYPNWWHWEESVNDYDGPIYGVSVQNAWRNYIEGLGPPWPNEWQYSTEGLRTAAEAARDAGIPFHAGIQSSGDMVWSTDHWEVGGNVEPTPRMIKCQGFLAMSFGAKGFFYSYFGCRYSKPSAEASVFAEPPFEHDRFQYVNGALNSGLLTFCPDINDTSDHTIDSPEELEDARDNRTGWLWRSPKWEAAREFNQYVRCAEPVYSNLEWYDSKCAEDQNPISYVRIDTTYRWYAALPQDTMGYDVEKYVQVGIFHAHGEGDRYFMLVNRRCDEGGGRDIRFTVDYPSVIYSQLYAITSLEIDNDLGDSLRLLSEGFGDRTVTYYLPPGEGRLFVCYTNELDSDIDNAVSIRGGFLVEDPVTVTSQGSLTILPGSQLTFTDDGKLTVYGRLSAVGKPDSTGDSTVTFTSINSDLNGLIQLKGSQRDSLVHCKFKHLKKGLKVVKGTAGKVYVNNCEFGYCEEEGIYVSGGEITIYNSSVHDNGTDGAYLYNCTAYIDSADFRGNAKNGLYAYSISGQSTINHSDFLLNGSPQETNPKAGIRFFNCSPKLFKSSVVINGHYGLYGANGAYPVMYKSGTAANTVEDNEDHETYWQSSYPQLDYGHNNFTTEDDTVIYLTGSLPSSFYARGNYWGGGPPDTSGSDGSKTYYGSPTFYFKPYDTQEQTRAVPGGTNDFKMDDDDPGNRICDDGEDAQELLRRAIDVEEDNPLAAIDDYRRLISEYSATAAAPVAVERLLWLVRGYYGGEVRMDRLNGLTNYFSNIADTCQARALAWKTRRAALWALAVQHRYDEAIAGFEAIIRNPDCLADSVFAVIDAGTLHLEAQEWAERDSLDRIQSIFGSVQELAPASFEEHRRHTDELLALLGMESFNSRAHIPREYFLSQNYPNPFNFTTQIRYGLPESRHVKLVIYDLMGRRVATLVDEPLKAGYYTALWDGRDSSRMPVSSGLYFCRIQAGPFGKVRKMTLVK